jgi:hypothetical protein
MVTRYNQIDTGGLMGTSLSTDVAELRLPENSRALALILSSSAYGALVISAAALLTFQDSGDLNLRIPTYLLTPAFA